MMKSNHIPQIKENPIKNNFTSLIMAVMPLQHIHPENISSVQKS